MRTNSRRGKKRYHWGFWAFAIIAATSVAGSLAANPPSSTGSVSNSIQYEAKGSLTYLIDRGRSVRFTREFRVAVSNCDWEITVTADDNKDTDYYDIVHLGDCIYYYTSLGKLSPGSGLANNGTAIIEHSAVPVENASFANYVWLGLASSCYFQESAGREIQPMWLARDVQNAKVKADWEVLDSAPFLPRHVVYYQKPGLLPAPFDKGWKGAALRVVSVTNTAGLEFPLDLVYEQFKTKQDATNADDVEVQFQVRMVVRSTSLALQSPLAPPETHGVTVVEERRLSPLPASLSGIQYPSGNARLPQVPEKAAVEQYKRAVDAFGMTKGKPSVLSTNSRIALLAFFIFSAAGFALLALKKHTT